MPLIERVQNILLRPRQTWPQIARESADVASIYRDYLVVLAAVPAVAGFIGLSLIGFGGSGLGVRVPVLTGLVQMAVSYLSTLAILYVMALVVDALAPSFGGARSPVNAMKLVAYGSTAALVGGVFSLLPALGVLGLAASLYSIYLIYLGLPVLMKCTPGKAGVYTAVVIVCGIVAVAVLSAVSTLVVPGAIVRSVDAGSAVDHPPA